LHFSARHAIRRLFVGTGAIFEGRRMRLGSACLLTLAACLVGCAGNELTPIAPVGGGAYFDDQNIVYIPLGRESYGIVFENVLQVLGDYGFQLEQQNRYDGSIETLPRVAPGVGLFLKPGSPDLYERFLSTAQSYRHRVSVKIDPAVQGGYFIIVVARKELEDLPRPIKSAVGAAIFHIDTNVDRDFEVIDPNRADGGWIYKGRDGALEQELIRRLKKLM
jgi:hypothetical protein